MAKTIAVSAQGPNLDSLVDPTFERCNYFIFVDPETMDFSIAKNPGADLLDGAGMKAAEFIVWHGVTTILTSEIHENIKAILIPADVDVIIGAKGTVKDAVLNYRESSPQTASIKAQKLLRHRSYGTS